MMKFFKKKYSYSIPKNKNKIELELLFSNWVNGNDYGEIKIIDKVSDKNLSYQYICSSRLGVIKIQLLQDEKNIHLLIEQSKEGFFPLVFFLICSLYLFIKGIFGFAAILFSVFLFFIFLFIMALNNYSKIIKAEFDEILIRKIG